MKFRIYLSENETGIPFNYINKLYGILSSCLSDQEMEDTSSLLSVGWLGGSKVEQDARSPQEKQKGALFFRGGARWDIGLYDNEIAIRLLGKLQHADVDFYGMQVTGAEVLSAPSEAFEKEQHRFLVNSPVLLQRPEPPNGFKYVLYRDPESGRMLTREIRRRAELAGIVWSKELNLFFDPNFRNAKTRLINIQSINIKASVCPVIAVGPPEALEFVWTVGAGEKCDLGFGSLYHTT